MVDSVTIYHNPRCSKSRQTLSLIKDQGVEPTVVDYQQNPISKAALKRILKSLDLTASELIRQKEKLFKELCSDGQLTNDEAIQLLVDHPKLMERPIVVKGDQAIIGRPPENVLELL